jgi:pSer/pThr/pTyr-binding forkhead associated (FHA) protein
LTDPATKTLPLIPSGLRHNAVRRKVGVDEQQSATRFLQACEAARALRLEVADTRSGDTRRWSFPQPYVVIGREDGSGLRLDDPELSRRHVYLQIVRGRIFCVDLASRTGIRLGGTPARAGWLGHDQPLEVGPYVIRLCEGEPEQSPVQGPLPDVELTLWEGGIQRAQWRVERVLALMGRSSGCNLQLGNADVPRFLCSLLRTSQGIWIVDVEGRGVSVNGTFVSYARISDGDNLRAGPYTIRFRCGEAPPSIRLRAVGLDESDEETLSTEKMAVDDPSRALAPRAPRPSVVAWPGSTPAPDTVAAETLLLQVRDQLDRAPAGSLDDSLMQPMMMMMAQVFGSVFREHMNLVREELGQIRELTREMETLRARLESTAATRPAPAPRPALGASPAASRTAPVPRTKPPDTPQEAASSTEDLDKLHAVLSRRIAQFQQERDSRWQKLFGAMLGRASG